VLVLQNRFWVLVVESKEAGFSLKEAISQALAYMIGNPYPDGPSFGLTTNGSEFRFLKLVKQETPRYALSTYLPSSDVTMICIQFSYGELVNW